MTSKDNILYTSSTRACNTAGDCLAIWCFIGCACGFISILCISTFVRPIPYCSNDLNLLMVAFSLCCSSSESLCLSYRLSDFSREVSATTASTDASVTFCSPLGKIVGAKLNAFQNGTPRMTNVVRAGHK